MVEAQGANSAGHNELAISMRGKKRRQRRRLLILGGWSVGIAVLGVASVVWVAAKAAVINRELEAAIQLVPHMKQQLVSDRPEEAVASLQRLRAHTSTARETAEDPAWKIASAMPWVGANFSAVAEVARSANDVAVLGLSPLVTVFDSLSWDSLLPSGAGTDLKLVRKASPSISSAAHAVRATAERLDGISIDGLLPQVAEPLGRAKAQLEAVTGALDSAADASHVAPIMLGVDAPRNYLLMIQNNAESRASGGIPGALAVVRLDKGKLTLHSQSSAGDVGVMSPVVPVSDEQKQIYSERLGKFMQDVNLTPDFPTSATTARAMWQRKTGQQVDGVLSVDPVALSYILNAVGPIKIDKPELVTLAKTGLPTELTGKNVVSTLLSDVYAKIELPELQDAYFAGISQQIFESLSDGKGGEQGIVEGLTRGAAEGRILLWSGRADEQKVLAKYPLSGSIAGPSISPAQFGVYFNDGTGAKMDYHVKRSAQLIKECSTSAYEQVRVRVTSTNTAPDDAATSLPAYVTGAGAFGIPAGTVQTNIVAYGPVQAHVETAIADGKKIGFASHLHSGRPVGAVTVSLPPGKSSTVEFTFGKIIQDSEPELAVTPTVQAREEVVLDPIHENCVPTP